MSTVRLVVLPERPQKVVFRTDTKNFVRLCYYATRFDTGFSELVMMLIEEKLNELDKHYKVRSIDGLEETD